MAILCTLKESLPSALETADVLRQASLAHRYLGNLKGAAPTIPNESILISTLGLQEAKDSSAVENIITTDDELYQSDFLSERFQTPEAKEVHHYSDALREGWERVVEQKMLRMTDILAIQARVVGNDAGFRKIPGTKLTNERTGEVVYEPPQDLEDIRRLMDDFLTYFNAPVGDPPDPLVRMAALHYQFESIHPFHDGNGRTGRILNLLYLVNCGLLDLPILYLSRYIMANKPGYYAGLQNVRAHGAWEAWTLYMLKGVEQTARETLEKVRVISDLMQSTKQRLRTELPKLYGQDLLNNLFRHPYTRSDLLQKELAVGQSTASRYLRALAAKGFVRELRVGRNLFYVNDSLVAALVPSLTTTHQ